MEPKKKADPRIPILVKWLDRQTLDSSIADETIWNKMKLSKATFYRLKPKAVEKRASKAKRLEKAVEATEVQQTIEAAKNGLKSKIDRLLLLQSQVEACEKDLKAKKLSVMEKVALRRALKDLQAEISKIEGDYAPEKQNIKHEGSLDMAAPEIKVYNVGPPLAASEEEVVD